MSLLGACQIGSGLFGDWFWWLYLVVSDCAITLRVQFHHVDFRVVDSAVCCVQALDFGSFSPSFGTVKGYTNNC